MFGRPLRTALSLLNPTVDLRVGERDQRMESQYNQKHGVKSRMFHPQDIVSVQDFTKNGWAWKKGVIQQRLGNVHYNVLVNGAIRKRHANQIRFKERKPIDPDSRLVRQKSAISPLMDMLASEEDTAPRADVKEPLSAPPVPAAIPAKGILRKPGCNNDPSVILDTPRERKQAVRFVN
jgi:hypothetical protein